MKQNDLFGEYLSVITYKNRDAFITAVAWWFILYGVFAGYSSLGQLIITVWFVPEPPVSVFLVSLLLGWLLFSAASLSCGLGMRKRSMSALKALVFFLWLYVIFRVGLNIWSYVDQFFMTSPPNIDIPALVESLERSARQRFARAVFTSTVVVLECTAVFWLLGQLSSSLIQDEFK